MAKHIPIIDELRKRGIEPARRYWYKGPDGDVHVMSAEEVAAIERSGKSCTVQEYALGHRIPPDQGATVAMLLTMAHDRPGAVEPGERPVYSRAEAIGRIKTLGQLKAGLIHLSVLDYDRKMSVRSCDGVQYAGSGAYPRRVFAGMVDHARACVECIRNLKELED